MKRKYFVGPVAAFGALFLFFSHSTLAAGRQFLNGHLPPAASTLQPAGRLAATNHLRLAIGLPLRDQISLSNLLHDLYDPHSSQFHHYLTPEEFAHKFGPSEADYHAVTSFAHANGFRITATHPNRVLLDVDASVADIERVLHVKMLTYRHPTEDRTFYAPDTEPSLDLDISVLHISGLDNYSLPRPRLQTARPINPGIPQNSPAPDGSMPKETAPPVVSSPAWSAGNIFFSSAGLVPSDTNDWPVLPNAGSGPSGSYMGKDFRAAYAPGVSLTGSGQSIGLLQFDGYTASDITYYESNAGLPSVTLSNVLIDGATGLPSGSGGEVEVSLDIEMSISMAPGLSKIYLYEAANPSPFVDILSRMANDNLAKQLSCSWYQPNGPSNAVADQIFQQMAAQGQTFFSAAGDNDAYIGLIPFPGDTPYITEVGGTTLTTTGPAGPYVSETVWNRGNGIGTGGGISTQYPIPSWQTNINMVPIQGSGTMRNIPDVALTAENVDVRADGVDQVVGGTSCAAPLWAGFTALVNQQAANSGKPSVGFLNPAVYAIGAQANYSQIFHDTTNGNNTSSSSPTKFYAAPGYDLCTGWGTPAGQTLINALVAPVLVTVPISATEGAGLLAGAGQIQLPTALGTNVSVTLTCNDPLQVSVPPSVTIPAGQTNVGFNLTILNDGILDGTQTATVTALIPGMGSASASMTIFDAQTATLQVLLPGSVTKGQGAAQGTVQVSAPVGANVTAALSSSVSNLIQVPASIAIPTGQTSAVFTATVLTDGQINGGQTVNVTAHVQNWTDGVAAVSVQDNVNLTVSLPGSAWENVGVLTNAGSVSLAGKSATNIVVTLISSNPSKLIVPGSVTIFAGSLSNAFNVTPVYSPLVEGHQTITVTANAPGFNSGSASMVVLDVQTPPFPSNPRPANLATNVPANTNLTWANTTNNELIANGGFETGDFTGWTQVANINNSRFYINNGTLKPFSPDPALPPYAGSFSALGDENGPGVFYIYQTVSVPANATSATLSWAHRVRNFYSMFSSIQQFQVRICDTNNNVLATAFTTNPGDPLLQDWVQKSYDMSTFAGKTVRVMFWLNPGGYYLDVHLDNVSLQFNAPSTNSLGAITNDVYFGTDPVPGPADYQGSTTNTSWTLPLLAPQTTYYWQIIAHRVGSATGAVWQFTTAGVDHFSWSNISSPQIINQPFGVTVTAQDAFNRAVTNFTGPVNLSVSSGLFFGDDFESGNFSSWTIGSDPVTRAVTSGTAASGIYSFTIIGGVSNQFEGVWHSLSNITPAQVTFYVRASDTTHDGGYFILANAADGPSTTINNTAVFFLQDKGVMGLYDTFNSYTVPYVANQWYKVSLMFNWTNKAVDYYVNGTLAHAAVPFRASTVNSLSIVHLYNFDNTQAWWDNIQFLGSNAPGTITISPTNSGNFVNGVWSGNVTVQAPATNAFLRADDGNSHTGNSNPFDVHLLNDLYISTTASTNLVSVGGNLTYTLTIANTGPNDATGVVVTNLLPAKVNFVSVVSSQGTFSQSGGLVNGSLGIVPGGSNATVTIVVTPAIAGVTLTNVAIVSRAEADAYLGNNIATNLTQVTGPAISIADSSCLEGNVGTTNMIFNVTLAVPSAQTITVDYATTNGIALAGKDYIATNGIIAFAPGITNQTIAVAVIGNTIVEPNKTFFVNLSLPINGTLARSRATGTIINDDGLPGQFDHFNWNAISSPQFVNQLFPVTITALDYSNNVVTNFNGTANLSATASGGLRTNMVLGNVTNLDASSGSYSLGYSFTPNTNLTVTHVRSYFGSKVSIWTDAGALLAAQNVSSVPGTWVETPLATPLQLAAGSTYRVACYTGGSNYYWRYDLTNTFADGVINQSYEFVGDNFPTGVDSVRWWFVDLRYNVGTSASLPMSPSVSAPFTNGIWNGNITVQAPATNAVLLANDGNGHTGNSNPFEVDFANDISISIAAAPSPVSVGANLTYTLTVSNTGPSDATDVIVTNLLPANVTVLAILQSQFACSQNNAMVIGALGDLPGGSNATITVIVAPILAGTILTNVATVSRSETDAYLGNNIATNFTQVTTPAISIADSSCLEGNVGTTNMLFTVSLAVPSAQAITVNYATTNGIALAGKDYIATNGLITFAPGVTNQTIAVAVIGNTIVEPNKTFFVNLSNPVNGTLARSQATGDIINDDGFPGQIDHFVWNSIAFQQSVGQPFAVSITALDYFNNVVTNFSGPVSLSASSGSGSTNTGGILVVQTGDTVSNTVLVALNNLGKPYTFVVTPALASLNLSNYSTVILGMDGGSIGYADMAALFSAVNGGVNLIAIGGSALPSYASGLNDFFFRINTNDILWNTVAGTPHFSVTAPTHPLAADLPASFNFTNVNASSYMARITDGAATNVAFNGDGFACLTTKRVGQGTAVLFINSPYDYFWTYPSDFALLRTIIANSLNWVQANGAQPVPITPLVSGAFSNGVWTGMVTVQEAANNALLTANDGNGHTGNSGSFAVVWQNDISISMAASASPASAGSNLTYTLSITNSGPTDATGVTVTNLLPANVSFISATSSQGTCSQSGGMVIGDLGMVPGGTNAIITITVVPTLAATTLTNSATVSRNEADAYLGNNVATNLTPVTVPAISIADSSCLEGNVGTTNMLFNVSLSAPSAQTITVYCTTANGTALGSKDYIVASGAVQFAPGVTNQTFPVAVIGNTIVEPNKTFYVNLSVPVNGTLGRSQATGTIINDDGLPGNLYSIKWSSIAATQYVNIPFSTAITALDYSNNVATNFNGTVSLSSTVSNQVGANMDFETGSLAPWTPLNLGVSPGPYQLVTFDVPGTGVPSIAFRILANSGTPDGITQNIPLIGGSTYSVDMDIASDNESIYVNLDGGTTAILIGGTTVAQYGFGQISNGQVLRYHLHGAYTAPTNGAYPVTLTFYRAYLEATNLWDLADNVRIVGPASALSINPTISGYFSNGIWTGAITPLNSASNAVLSANDGNGHIGFSNPFNVITAAPPVVLVQPVSQTVLGGSNVTFSVTATGTLPLNYFWQQNNFPLSGPNIPSLTLSNVVRTNSGAYNVIITNMAGSAVSSNAMLVVHVPELLSRPTWLPDGTLLLSANDLGGGAISATNLSNFTAQASSNLVNWVTLPGALTVTNGALQLHDVGATNSPMQFYRILEKW